MKTAILVTPLAIDVPDFDDADYIGVDAGALMILESNHKLKLAVGDFDSMSDLDFKRLACPIEKHPVMKDETDSELALRLCKEYDRIILYGGLTGRIDHTIANIRLIMYRFPNVILMDDKQMIRVFKEGNYVIDNTYQHISFYAIEKSQITLSGFLYNLNSTFISESDIYTTSNSLVEDEGLVKVEKGRILCVQSNWR